MARNTRKDVILIPWDYTDNSIIALEHGIQLAKEVNNYIMLVRFIEKPGLFGNKQKMEELAKEENAKLQQAGEEISKKYGVNPYIAVVKGISKKSVKQISVESNANLIVASNSYKVNDSKTYKTETLVKLLTTVDIPFIFTQTAPAHNYYKEIVVPVYPSKYYKETLHWVIYLAKHYNCNINILKSYIEDPNDKKEMASNMYFTKKTLDKKGIIYGIKTAKKKKVFEDEIFRFAEMIDSDIIVMMVKNFKKFIEKNPNYDKQIPIMVINRNTEIIKYGGSFRG